jgi:hypothetical protein
VPKRGAPQGGQFNGRPQQAPPNTNPGIVPRGGAAPGAGGASGGGSGAGGSGAGGASGGTGKGAALRLPLVHVLAQVGPAPGAQPTPNPANSKVPGSNPSIVTPQNPALDPNRPRQLSPALREQARQAQNGGAQQPATGLGGTSGLGGQFGIDLGVVNIQAGGGQLQQRLEGIRVANVVGQSVLVVPVDAMTNNNASITTQANRRLARGQATAREAAALQQQANGGSLGVVAAGVIQFVGQGQTANSTTTQSTTIPGTAQGSNVAPAAGNGTSQVPQTTPTGLDRTQR